LHKLIFIGYFPVFHGGRLIGSRDKKNNSRIKLFSHFVVFLFKEKVIGFSCRLLSAAVELLLPLLFFVPVAYPGNYNGPKY
jgi:hypothetical protein